MYCYLFKDQESMEQTLQTYQIPNDQIQNKQIHENCTATVNLKQPLPTNPFWELLQKQTKAKTMPAVDFLNNTAFWYDVIQGGTIKNLCTKLTEQRIPKSAIVSILYDSTFYEMTAVIQRTWNIKPLREYADAQEQKLYKQLGILTVQKLTER